MSVSTPNPPLTLMYLGLSPQHDPQHKSIRKQGNVHDIQARIRALKSLTVSPLYSWITSMSCKNIAVSTWALFQQQQQQLSGSWRLITRLSVRAMNDFGPQHCEQPSSHSYVLNRFSPLNGAKVFSKWRWPPGCVLTGCCLINRFEMIYRVYLCYYLHSCGMWYELICEWLNWLLVSWCCDCSVLF